MYFIGLDKHKKLVSVMPEKMRPIFYKYESVLRVREKITLLYQHASLKLCTFSARLLAIIFI